MGEFAVVTGGSTGIGRHLVSAFAEAGYTVAFSYRHDDEAAQSLVEAIEEAGGQALGLGCDVGRRVEVESFFDEVCDWFGDAPDVLGREVGTEPDHDVAALQRHGELGELVGHRGALLGEVRAAHLGAPRPAGKCGRARLEAGRADSEGGRP